MDAASQDPGQFWASFGRDPRVSDNQGLRAGDRDRDIMREAITEAYAEGRLTQDEMDARLTSVLEARLLGDLPPIVADLMPARETASPRALVAASEQEINRRAELRYREQRRQALAGMLVPSLICLTIWIWSMVSTGGLIFPWPVFVILGTGGYLMRLVFGRESAIEDEREKLRKKEAKRLAAQSDPKAITAEDDPPEEPEQGRRDHWR